MRLHPSQVRQQAAGGLGHGLLQPRAEPLEEPGPRPFRGAEEILPRAPGLVGEREERPLGPPRQGLQEVELGRGEVRKAVHGEDGQAVERAEFSFGGQGGRMPEPARVVVKVPLLERPLIGRVKCRQDAVPRRAEPGRQGPREGVGLDPRVLELAEERVQDEHEARRLARPAEDGGLLLGQPREALAYELQPRELRDSPHAPARRRQQPLGQVVQREDLRLHEDARVLGREQAALGLAAADGRRHDHQASSRRGRQGVEVGLEHRPGLAAAGGTDDEFDMTRHGIGPYTVQGRLSSYAGRASATACRRGNGVRPLKGSDPISWVIQLDRLPARR